MAENTPKVEVWGTYSVRDHLRSRAFVADVLLYDQLVIPRPPTPVEEAQERNAARDRGETVTPPAIGHDGKYKTEVDRWSENGWRPRRLEEMLKILREHRLVVELPWSEQARLEWARLYSQRTRERVGTHRAEIAAQAKDELESKPRDSSLAYALTGSLIATHVYGGYDSRVQRNVVDEMAVRVRATGSEIEPVIACPSYQTLLAENLIARPLVATHESKGQDSAHLDGAQQNSAGTNRDISAHVAVFGWDFFVPRDPDKTDLQMLGAAAELASRPSFRAARQAFYGWLRLMYDRDFDPEQTRSAMLRMLAEYRDEVRRIRLPVSVRRAAKIVEIGGPPTLEFLASTYAPGVGTVGAKIAGRMLSPFFKRCLPIVEPRETLRPAVMVHDARQHFGER